MLDVYLFNNAVKKIDSYSEVDYELLYCKDYSQGARVAVYNKGEPKQVEVIVKGLGHSMEIKTQLIYLFRDWRNKVC